MVHGNFPSRDPQNTQAWLVGGGIGSLAAALHLIKDAKVPGNNIHVLDVNPGVGGGLHPRGDSKDGYFLPLGGSPHFHGTCLERLLSILPSATEPSLSVMDGIRTRAKAEPEAEPARAKAVRKSSSGPELFDPHGIQVGIKHRMAVVGLMLESESSIAGKKIEDVFDKSFFHTTFWSLWSNAFALQSCHSATEFKRHLRKYLEDIKTVNSVNNLTRTKYNLYESLVLPLTTFLKQEGTDFRFNCRVGDLQCYPEGDPTTVSEIKLRRDGEEELITVDPVDIVIVTLGSIGTGATMGTNKTAPPPLASNWQELMHGDWTLWESLAKKSMKFGSPTNFASRNEQSVVSTFTTTFAGPEFPALYEELTHDKAANGAHLSLSDSPWQITISIPHQPLFASQPRDTTVMIGYGLKPSLEGLYVKKPMYRCSGEEILQEVLAHLEFDAEPISANARTIPCAMPLGTAPFLTRHHHDRPSVIPALSTNLACVGQFVEIADDTTLEVEYSVRGAQVAVSHLMNLPSKPVKPLRSLLLEVFDMMI